MATYTVSEIVQEALKEAGLAPYEPPGDLGDPQGPDEENDVLSAPAGAVKTKLLDFDPLDRELDEAHALEEGLRKVYDPLRHPRWPKGMLHAGEFMRVGQRFEHEGHEWEIAHVVDGGVIANEASGKAAHAQAKFFEATKTADGLAIPGATYKTVTKITGKKGGAHGSGNAPVVDPFVDASTHDPKLKIPEGSDLNEAEWKEFGRLDQLNYIAIMRQLGKWKPAKAQSMLDNLYKEYDSSIVLAVKSAIDSQYGSSSGKVLNLATLFQGITASPASLQQAQARYEKARELQGDMKNIVQWDLYNRVRAPDVAAIHEGSGDPSYYKEMLQGTGAIMSGWSMTWKLGTQNFGPVASGVPLAIRHVFLSTDSAAASSGGHSFKSSFSSASGEHELAVADQMVMGPHGHGFSMNYGQAKPGSVGWLKDQTKENAASGRVIRQFLGYQKGLNDLPIPPPPPGLTWDALAGQEKTYVELPGDIVKKSGVGVFTLKPSLVDEAGNKVAKSAADLGLHPGDFIEGMKGARYLIIADPGQGDFPFRYVRIDPTTGLLVWSKAYTFEQGGQNQFYKLQGHIDLPKPKKEAGFEPFTAEQYAALAVGPMTKAEDMQPGAVFKLNGEGFQVVGKAADPYSYGSTKVQVRSLDTGKKAKVNGDWKTPVLVPKEGYEGALPPLPPEEPHVPAEPSEAKPTYEAGDPVLVTPSVGAPFVGNVESVSPFSKGWVVTVKSAANGDSETFATDYLHAPPDVFAATPAQGHIFPHEGAKFTVTTVLKNGTVKAKMGSGPVQAFAKGHPALESAFPLGDYQLGDKTNTMSLSAGDVVSSSGAKPHPYMVLGMASESKWKLRNLETGETVVALGKKGWWKLNKKSGVEPPAAGEKDVQTNVTFDPDLYTPAPKVPFQQIPVGGYFQGTTGQTWEKIDDDHAMAVTPGTIQQGVPAGFAKVQHAYAPLVPKASAEPEVEQFDPSKFDVGASQPFADMSVGTFFHTGSAMHPYYWQKVAPDKIKSLGWGDDAATPEVSIGEEVSYKGTSVSWPVLTPKGAEPAAALQPSDFKLGEKMSFDEMPVGSYFATGAAAGWSYWQKAAPNKITKVASNKATGVVDVGETVAYSGSGVWWPVATLKPATPEPPQVAPFAPDAYEPMLPQSFGDMPLGTFFQTKTYGKVSGVWMKLDEGHAQLVHKPEGTQTGKEVGALATVVSNSTKYMTLMPKVAPPEPAEPEPEEPAEEPLKGLKGWHVPAGFTAGVKKQFADMPVGQHFAGAATGVPYVKTSEKSAKPLDKDAETTVAPGATFVTLTPQGAPVQTDPSKFDPSNYVEGEMAKLADMPEGAIFKSATGLPMQLKSKKPAKGATAVALHNGKLVKNIPYDKPLVKLEPKPALDEVPHGAWAVGDQVPFDKLEVGDRYKVMEGLQTVQVVDKSPAGKLTIQSVLAGGELGGKSMATGSLAQQGGTVIYQGAAEPATVPPSKVEPGDLKPPPGFEPYKQHKSGTAKHHKVWTLQTGQSFVDKAGNLWKVKQTGSQPVITDGEQNYVAPPDAFVKLAEDAGVAPLAKEGPALGNEADWKSKKAEDKIVPNTPNHSLQELHLKPGDVFKNADGMWAVKPTFAGNPPPGGFMPAAHLESGEEHLFPPMHVPTHASAHKIGQAATRANMVLLKAGTLASQPNLEWFHVVAVEPTGKLVLDNKIGGTVPVTHDAVLEGSPGDAPPPVYKFAAGDYVHLGGGVIGKVEGHTPDGEAIVDHNPPHGDVMSHPEDILTPTSEAETTILPLKLMAGMTATQLSLADWAKYANAVPGDSAVFALKQLDDSQLAKVIDYASGEAALGKLLALANDEHEARAQAVTKFKPGDKATVVDGDWVGKTVTVKSLENNSSLGMGYTVEADDGAEGLLFDDELAHDEPGEAEGPVPGVHEHLPLELQPNHAGMSLDQLPVGALYAFFSNGQWEVKKIVQHNPTTVVGGSNGSSLGHPSPTYTPPQILIPRSADDMEVPLGGESVPVAEFVGKVSGWITSGQEQALAALSPEQFDAVATYAANYGDPTTAMLEKTIGKMVAPEPSKTTFAAISTGGHFSAHDGVWQKTGGASAELVAKTGPNQLAPIGFKDVFPVEELVVPASPPAAASPLVPYLHPKGGKVKHTKLSDVPAGEKFADKSKAEYTVVAHHGDQTTFEASNGDQFQAPGSTWVKHETPTAESASSLAQAWVSVAQPNHTGQSVQPGDSIKYATGDPNQPYKKGTVAAKGGSVTQPTYVTTLGDHVDGFSISAKLVKYEQSAGSEVDPSATGTWPDTTNVAGWTSSWTTGGKLKYPALKVVSPGSTVKTKDNQSYTVVAKDGLHVLLQDGSGEYVTALANTHVSVVPKA